MTTDRRVDLLHPEVPEAPSGPTWAVLTSETPRGRVYQRVVRARRVPRLVGAPPRSAQEGANYAGVIDDPAPDWAWMLVRGVLQHTAPHADHGEALVLQALAWVDAGDAVLPMPTTGAALPM